MDHWMDWMQGDCFGGWNRDLSGYAASAFVLATFAMHSMRRLRLTAILSNLAFIFYALDTNLHPILVLHSLLLPLNIFRLIQIERSRVVGRRADDRRQTTGQDYGHVLPSCMRPSRTWG